MSHKVSCGSYWGTLVNQQLPEKGYECECVRKLCVCVSVSLCVQYRKRGARHLHTCTKGYAGSAILSPRQAPQISASSQYNTMHCTLVPSMQKSWAGQSFGYSLNIPHKERSMISYTLWFWFHLNARSGQES